MRASQQYCGNYRSRGIAASKIRGRFRWQMLIKGRDINALHQIAKDVMNKNKNLQIKITVDVDPENFM